MDCSKRERGSRDQHPWNWETIGKANYTSFAPFYIRANGFARYIRSGGAEQRDLAITCSAEKQRLLPFQNPFVYSQP
jgi:hypothetical protein